MDLEKKNEEIIELTEVLEEGPAFAARRDPGERLPSNPERKKEPLRPHDPNDTLSALPESSARMMKEILTRQVENWTAGEGTRLVERLTADSLPRIVAEKLSPEVAKLKTETDGLRTQGEAFSRKLVEWFSSEGLKILEQKAREEIPRVAAEALHPEIEAGKREMQKFQDLAAEMGRRTQSWLEGEGRQILEKVARELFPPLAEKILRQEIEKLKEESETAEKE